MFPLIRQPDGRRNSSRQGPNTCQALSASPVPRCETKFASPHAEPCIARRGFLADVVVSGVSLVREREALGDHPRVYVLPTSATGELVFHVFGAIAHFERRLISERTRDGIAAARKRGRTPGPPASRPGDRFRRSETHRCRVVARSSGTTTRYRQRNGLQNRRRNARKGFRALNVILGKPSDDASLLTTSVVRRIVARGNSGLAGRRWAGFKDKLPEVEGWSEWVDWYEGRLTGRPADEAKEFERMTNSDVGRRGASGENAEPASNPRSSGVANSPSPHEEEDQERRYYTDEGFGRYVTAHQFTWLSQEEQTACMVRWFRQMYEDPANATPYDSGEGGYIYIWGGPYEARDEIGGEFGDLVSDDVIEAAVSEVESDGTFDWAPTDSNPKHTAWPDDNGADDNEGQLPPTLSEIRDRLASGYAPHFGDPIETESRKALRKEIAGLREELERSSLHTAGPGHNRPPEPLALTIELTLEVKQAAEEIDAEVKKPAPNVETVAKSTGRLEKVVAWIGRKLEISVDAFMASIGSKAGLAVLVGAGLTLVGERLAQVFHAALEWLNVVSLPF